MASHAQSRVRACRSDDTNNNRRVVRTAAPRGCVIRSAYESAGQPVLHKLTGTAQAHEQAGGIAAAASGRAAKVRLLSVQLANDGGVAEEPSKVDVRRCLEIAAPLAYEEAPLLGRADH